MVQARSRAPGVIVGLLVLLVTNGRSSAAAPARARRREVVEAPIRVEWKGKGVTVSPAPALLQVMHRTFPGYDLPPITTFSSDTLEILSSEMHGKAAVPFACVGEFDGNGLPDVALFLKNRRSQWIFVAFHQKNRGTFRSYLLRRWRGTNGKIRVYIGREPRGKVQYLHTVNNQLEEGLMHLKYDGITEVFVEEAALLHYFWRGKYRHIHTAD
jgi:hypothetical protein